jgi:hypothetical protein
MGASAARISQAIDVFQSHGAHQGLSVHGMTGLQINHVALLQEKPLLSRL